MLGCTRSRVKHVSVENVSSNDAVLTPASELHRNVYSAEYNAFLAPLQFAVQLFLRNCAGIRVAE
jgi:hypothetical protein